MIRLNIIIDKLLLFILLPLLLPLSLYVFLIIKKEGYNPIFKQKRIGKNKTIFTLYKFRSMKPNAPEKLTHECSKDYYLNCAKIIRRFKLDELPQLINVFNGTMSLIGPRPGLVIDKDLIKERQKRNLYNHLPGITGYSQIMDINMDDPIKLANADQITIKLKQNIFSYFLILIATVFSSRSIYKKIIMNFLNKIK